MGILSNIKGDNMENETREIKLRVESSLYERLRVYAERERRSINNAAGHLLSKQLSEESDVSDTTN